ncbi:hypothetical protein PVAP13_5NG333086 [Panicum virgatum]|uniref:Uncharacterized protein n=1 Tax=Panicum virgatum TaxID=38727 RepID=A0A8T0RV29_PANVG|nr:hypothetical protein PVAP13_5NG333086 [Panicum virgatum]
MPDEGNLDQVKELMALIAAHKEMNVTGASVVFDFVRRRIQPLQKRFHYVFEDIGAEDPSRMCADELSGAEALVRTKKVLLDVGGVPYVPKLFSAVNPPHPDTVATYRSTPFMPASSDSERTQSAASGLAKDLPEIPKGRRVCAKRKTSSIDSPSSPSPGPKKQKGAVDVASVSVGDDVLVGIPITGARTDPLPDSNVVTVTTPRISSGQDLPSTGSGAGITEVFQTPVLGTPKPRVLKLKKLAVKKSTLTSAVIGLEDTSSEVPPAPEQHNIPPPEGENLVPEPPAPEQSEEAEPRAVAEQAQGGETSAHASAPPELPTSEKTSGAEEAGGSSLPSNQTITYQLIPQKITPEERRKIPFNLAFDPMLDRQKLGGFQELAQEMTQFTMDLYKQSELKYAKLQAVLDTDAELLDREERCKSLEEDNIAMKKHIQKLEHERMKYDELKTFNNTLRSQLKEQRKAHQDEVERLQKKLQDTDIQFVECMQTVKALSEEKITRDKELEELKVAAQAVVDMVDPLEDGAPTERSLLDRL